jgi:hypothetical protein
MTSETQKHNKLIGFLRDRIDERSTWRGIILILTILGVSFSPEQTEAILWAGALLGGAIEAALPDPGGKIRSRDQQ